MTFPLAFLLIPYTILLVILASVGGINIFHVVRFGTFDARNRFVVVGFLLYALSILVLVGVYCFSIDWTQSITLSLPANIELPFPSVSP